MIQVKECILNKLISHYEDLKRAFRYLKIEKNVDSLEKGFKLILKNFKKLLEEEGIKEMNCVGEKFDPCRNIVTSD